MQQYRHVAARHACTAAFSTRILTYHVFGEPDPPSGIDDDADTYTVEGGTRQVDAVPTGGRLVPHALLDVIHAAPGSGIGAGQTDILAAISVTGETFVRDTHTLVFPIWAGMTEAAVNHVPAMQACAPGQRVIPDERIETNGCTVLVDQLEQLLRQLNFFCRHWWRRPIGCYPGAGCGNSPRRRGRRNGCRFGCRRGSRDLAGNLEGRSGRWMLLDGNHTIGSEWLRWYSLATLRPTGTEQECQ